MASIKQVFGEIRYDIDRLDGGYNSKQSPSKIAPEESPDCLNVTFDIDGSVRTRDGTVKHNTTTIGSYTVDHGTSYNGDHILWANGQMWRNSSTSGTTFTAITSSSGHFATGASIAAIVYQNVLFTSDGTRGPWKYTGSENFYNMGVDIPSSPTGASIGAGSISTGTYYYGISFVNTQVVEGQIGSSSVGVTLTNSSSVGLTSIPVGSTLAGVNQRFVYRGDTAIGPFRKVGTINDNTTTTFTDTLANGGEGKFPVLDGGKPKAFNTIILNHERLFFDDKDDTTFIRYTEFQNPYITIAENQEPMNAGDGFPIVATGSQDNFVYIGKRNKAFVLEIVDPSDDTTWSKKELPGNIGITGAFAIRNITNGTVFVGIQNNRISGVHLLQGAQIVESIDGRLRSFLISEKIEYDILNNFHASHWDSIRLELFDNRLYMSYCDASNAAGNNNKIFWLDLTRIGTEEQPGSWAPWDNITAKCLYQHDGKLFGGESTSTGFVRRFNSGSYDDYGSAINSYFWTKEIGGEDDGSLDSYIKNLREIYVYYRKLGNYNMNVSVRMDGDSSNGVAYPISLSNAASLWGTAIWGASVWGGSRTEFQQKISINGLLGRRFQVRFDNQNTAGQAFRVHRLELGMKSRRRR